MRHSIGMVCVVIAGLGITAWSDNIANAAEKGFAIEEVLVTARRLEESLKDIPLSVTAITGDNLRALDAQDISAIADIAPNVNFSFGGTSSGSGSAAVVYIRGVGQNDFTPVTDPGVGIYVDGVYLGRTIGSVLDLLELERVEVLRGPQGTLFGRNTIGGAISLISKAPTKEWDGRLQTTVGDDNRKELFATVSGPLSDSIAVIASGMYRKRDGSVKRVLANDELGDDDVLGGRLRFEFTPSDRLSIDLSLDALRERESGAAEVPVDVNESALFSNFFNSNRFGNGTTDPTGCAGGGALSNPACQNDQWVGAPYTSYETGPNNNEVDTWGTALTVNYDLGDDLLFKSITAIRELDAEFNRPSDGSPHDIFSTQDTLDQEQFSQEFQLLATDLWDKVDWVSGLYYFEEQATNQAIVSAPPPVFPRNNGGSTDNDNWALYTEATVHVTDNWHLTGGLRYTEETKNYTPFLLRIPQNQFTIPNVAQPELNFDETTWRVSAAYDLSAAATTYFTASKGFKSGGYDLRVSNPTVDGLSPTYQPEVVIQYELGLKAELEKFRASLAVFNSNYDDVQVSTNILPEINTTTKNVATAEINGVEVEFRWVPISSVSIEGAFGWQDAEYTALGAGALAAGLSLQDELIRTPDFSGSLRIAYLWSLASGADIESRLSWVHKSKTHFEPVNDDFVAESGYDAVNISTTFSPAAGNWSLRLGLNNVTDERYIVAGDANGAIGYRLAVFARPRNWFASFNYSF